MGNWADSDDVDLVTRIYAHCWQKSKGRYNKWMPGHLSHCEMTFCLVLNALERILMDGMDSLVADDDRFLDPATGFTIAATAAAYEELGFPSQAAAIRLLGTLFPDGEVPHDRKERDARLSGAIEWSQWEAASNMFGEEGWQRTEQIVYTALAAYVRAHPNEFH